MDWTALAGTAPGALIALSATAITGRFKRQREQTSNRRALRQETYARFQAALTDAADKMHARAQAGHPAPQGHYSAVHDAFRSSPCYHLHYEMARANRKAPLAVFVFDDAIILTSPLGLTVTDLNAANLRAMKQIYDQFTVIAPDVSSEELAARLSKVVRVTVIPADCVVTAFADRIPVVRALRVHVQTASQGTTVFIGGGPAKRHLATMLKTVLGLRFTDRTGGSG